MNQYTVLGRKRPDEHNPNPEVYKMTIFAPNEVVAESRFWYHINELQKVKKAHGQTIAVQQVKEDETTVKNFGINLRYRDAIGHHNMYREVRETSAARAMQQIFSEMAGQYHIRYQDIQIIKFAVVDNFEDLRRDKTIMMTPHENHEVKFPHVRDTASLTHNSKRMRFVKKLPKRDF